MGMNKLQWLIFLVFCMAYSESRGKTYHAYIRGGGGGGGTRSRGLPPRNQVGLNLLVDRSRIVTDLLDGSWSYLDVVSIHIAGCISE